MRIDRIITLGLFVGFLGFYLLTTGAERPWGDGEVQGKLGMQLYAEGRLDFDDKGHRRWLFEGPDGKKYSTYSLGVAASMVPSAMAVAAYAPDKRPQVQWAVAHRTSNTLYGALVVALFFVFCRQLAVGRGPALVVAIGLGVATQLWVYTHSDFGETYQTLALLLAVMAAVYARDDARGAGWLLGLAWGHLFLAKVVYYALVPVTFAYLLWRWRARLGGFARLVGKAFVVAMPLLALALWYNWIRSGDPFGTGRQMDHFGSPMSGDLLVGLHGLLFSSGKGIFWFNPILLVSLFGVGAFVRRRGADAWFVLGVSATLVLVYGKYVFWHGAWSFGPRFLTCLVPLLILPLADTRLLASTARWGHHLVLAAALVVSAGVQLVGAGIYKDHHIHVNNAARRALLGRSAREGCGYCHENHYPTHFVPQFNAISIHWWLMQKQLLEWDDKTALRQAPWATYFPDKQLDRVKMKFPELDFWVYRDEYAHSRAGRVLWWSSVLSMLAGLGLLIGGLRRARREPTTEPPFS